MSSRRSDPCDPQATSTRAAAAVVLSQRALFSHADAERLKGLFKVLANEHRLRLLHAIERSGELCVTDLADAVGMSAQAVSGQLQRLVDRGILAARRDGNFVHYRIVDRCVTGLMDLAICLVEETEGRSRRPRRGRASAR